MKKYSLIAVGVVLGLVFVLVAWQIAERNYSYQGSLIDPPVPAADFSLPDQNGNPFRLSAQEGQVVLIFFGYTHCPDVCPVTLSEYKQIKQKLGEQADRVRFLFITVDPERDTLEQLQAYLPNFDPSFIGLGGTREQLEPVWQAYGVYQAKRETTSAGGYLVDHTSRIYLVDPMGNWKLTYPFGMDVEKIVNDIQHVLRNQ